MKAVQFNVAVPQYLALKALGLSLPAVLQEMEETHRRLVDYVHNSPEEQFTRETRFRRRLRLDTYSHYPHHAKAIRAWREGLEAENKP